jgi:hypothetical protein
MDFILLMAMLVAVAIPLAPLMLAIHVSARDRAHAEEEARLVSTMITMGGATHHIKPKNNDMESWN